MRFRFVAIFVFAYVAIVGLESVAVRAKAAGDAAPAGCRLPFDIACTFLGGRHEDPEVKAVADQVDDTEAVTLANLERHPARDPYHQIVTLGKLELYDKSLSVNKNIACASCHVPQTGFTSGVQLYNETIVAQPGSVPITDVSGMHPNWRIGPRKPMSYAYAPFSPVLHYVADQKTFVGGNFWDMRATGYRLQNPAAEQAQDPPTNPNEMADPDSACVVYSLSKAPEAYRHLFVQLWGAQSFAIHWPQNVERVCAMPASSHVDNPTALRLGRVDRGISDSTYEHFADAIAAFEASPEVSPFSSKFDAFLAGNVALDPAERRGYQLFNGQARCSQCHVDGSIGGGATIKYGKILLASATGPLFTDETSANLGIPKNDDSPYLYEDVPDQHGYVANSAGPSHLDLGVGAFLAGNLNPNPGQWKSLAPMYYGRIRVATLRNVDKRPFPSFVKAYMHNGYLKSLAEVVHFYNTRDVLPRCPSGDSHGAGKTCWPAPEYPYNLNHQIGNLGLSAAQESDVVAFLKTLTDGFGR